MKCEKNLLKLKRKPLKIKWTDAYRKEHKKVDIKKGAKKSEISSTPKKLAGDKK